MMALLRKILDARLEVERTDRGWRFEAVGPLPVVCLCGLVLLVLARFLG